MTPLIKQRDLMEKLITAMDGSKNIKVRCPSTVKSYCKSLRTVANKIDAYVKEDDETVFDYIKLGDTKLVLDAIKPVKKSTQKSYLEALVAVLTFQDQKLYKPSIDIYRKQKEVDRKEIDKQYKNNVLSDKQMCEWMDSDELQKCCVNYFEKQVKDILEKGTPITKKLDQAKLNNYVIGLLYGGQYLPPRRREYNNVKNIKIKLYNDLKENNKLMGDNYMILTSKQAFFSFGDYKTVNAKGYGVQRIDIPPELATKLKAIKKVSGNSEFLLPRPDKFEAHISKNGIGKLIPCAMMKCCKKSICSQTLRNIYTTYKFKQMISTNDKERIAFQMGTSLKELEQVYNKYMKNEPIPESEELLDDDYNSDSETDE